MVHEGILIVDKPKGWTSHDVVSFVKRKFRLKKGGHGGALDPIATGVLVLLIGHSTKKANLFLGAKKEYLVELRLGQATDTGDADGKIINEDACEEVPLATIQKTLAGFQGELLQVPPMFSAIKYKGRPLYELARKGLVVERTPRTIHIYAIELIGYRFPFLKVRVVSSKGTYIRTLCEQIGQALGTCAYMSALTRTQCGQLNIDSAVSVDTLKKLTSEEFASYVRAIETL